MHLVRFRAGGSFQLQVRSRTYIDEGIFQFSIFAFRNTLIEKQKRLNKLLGVKETSEQPVETENRSDLLPGSNNEDGFFEVANEGPSDDVYRIKTEHENEAEIIVTEHETAADHLEAEDENEEAYFETYESYDEHLDESRMYVVAVSDQQQEFEPDEEELERTIDQIEEEDQSEEQGVDEHFEMTAEFVDSDEEYVVYEEDITAEDGDKSKRKYTKRGKDEQKQYRCWIKACNSTFSFRAPMRKHMQVVHSIICDKTTCFMCGDRYDNSADFLAHVKMHTRKVECDVCKLSFVNEDGLVKHKKKFHSKKDDDVRNFECHCGARFKRKEHLSSHQIYKHSDKSERKFHCSECASSFLTRQDLRNHEKSHAQFKIKCVYCPYDCRDLKSMRRHCQKLHDTANIYRCSCQETFEIFREMQVHKKNCTTAQDTSQDDGLTDFAVIVK